jgi:hypothetical protein
MTVKRSIVYAAGVALWMLAIIPGASAGGSNPDQTGGDGSFLQDLDKRIQKDTSAADQSLSASALSVDELEATRADIDRRTGSPVSLSVSGWVGGEVSRTGK